jgi:hypothetical protein
MSANIRKIQMWRNRATHCRADAQSMRDAEAKRTLLELAAMYDRLAAKTEARLCVASKPREEEQQVAVPDRAIARVPEQF